MTTSSSSMERTLTAVRYRRRDTCRLCDSPQLSTVLSLVPTPIGDDFVSPARLADPQPTCPLDLMLCAACGQVQLLNVVEPDAIYREYTYTSSVSLGLVEHFEQYVDDVLPWVAPRANGLVVELGSNEGAMLRAFQSRGLRVLGVDPARKIAARATSEGIETLPEYFTPEVARTIRERYGPASLIVANNVFANIDDLHSVMAGVAELLSADGAFVFETSYLLDVVERCLLDTIFHEHVSYFSVGPLERFFRRHGMTFVDVVRVAPKGGSIRGFVQRTREGRTNTPAVTASIAEEQQAGLDQAAAFARLATTLEERKRTLLALLDESTRRGQTIAAYGAAVGLTTMLYQFGLGPYVSYIVDDSETKHGTFSPGLHLPVLPSSTLEERRPDATVILAWRYADAIVKRHAAYAAQGGRFILPLPDVQVVG